jgi:SpoVK/Ycf46/Vps4 family AAA+-type ATPase
MSKWTRIKDSYFQGEVGQQYKELPVGVYKIDFDETRRDFSLSYTQDKFTFPYKVYGVESNFVERVAKTYQNTTGNLGILLNGVKGTGKTVTSQMIANVLNLPVLIVYQRNELLPSFLNAIKQDVVIFFDEYEKLYNSHDSNILTVMDGVLNTEYRKVFLLTTNSLYLNENMLQRPGRIRYIKTFNDLSLDVIVELVDDLLEHKELREKCINFISTLETITIDIVKAIIQEVNIHNEEPLNFKDVFNIRATDNLVNLYTQNEAGDFSKRMYSSVTISPVKINATSVGEVVRLNDRYFGDIVNVLGEDKVVIRLGEYDEDNKQLVVTYRIERIEYKHQSFTSKFLV